MSVVDIKLFHRPGCPFCIRVMDYLRTTKNIRYKKCSTLKEENLRKVIKHTGSATVPAIYITSEQRWMKESADIIEKLKRIEAKNASTTTRY
jgi:glutaredoxin